MRRIRHGLLVIGLLGGLLIGASAPAGAGFSQPFWEITDSLDGYVDTLVLGIDNIGNDCDGGTTVVTFLGQSDNELGQADLSGTNGGTVTVPDDLAETILSLEVTCTFEEAPYTDDVFDPQEEGVFEGDYAGLDVTKVVEGDVPAGTEFVVNVDCEGEGHADVGPYDLTFATAGGVDRVWFSAFHECEVTEPQAGGAVSTTIVTEDCDEGGEGRPQGTASRAEPVVILGPVLCTATVTNVFADATTTTPSTTTTSAPPAEAVAPTAAAAAQPTVANPNFTG